MIVTFPLTVAAQTDDWEIDDEKNDGEYNEAGGTDSEDGTLGIYSEVEFSNSAGDTEPPAVTSALIDWEPPACWYEPRTAEWTRNYVENMLQSYAQLPEGDISDVRDRLADHYINGNPYANYNLDKADEGRFWFGVANPERRDDPTSSSCAGLAEWVELGDTPGNPLAVDPELLAQAAYEWLPLPETEVSLNPAADTPQTVNLPTWIWQDATNIGEVSATARLDSLDMEATTTATPSALTIDPGTDNADLHPANGTCPINNDGTIGQPYNGQDADIEPPCGVTYRHATNNEPYELTATITWTITWTGTGTPDPQPLPDATMETTHHLTVQEVQAIIR